MTLISHIRLAMLPVLLLIATPAALMAQQPTAHELYRQGVLLLQENKPAEALEKLEASVALDDTDPRPFALIGTIHFTFENYGRAVEAFRKAVELRPADPQVRAGLCRALAADGKVLEGIEECRQAVAIDPESQRANTDLIIVLQLVKSPPPDLGRLIERALARYPDNLEVMAVAAGFYELRDRVRSVELYERLASIQPENTHWHMHLAELYIELERDREAIDSANRVLALDPKNARAHFFVGRIYLELGQNIDASEALGRSVELDPKNEMYLQVLFEAERARRNYAGAEAALEKLVEIRPDSFAYQAELGDIRLKASKPEAALGPFKKALSLRPQDVPIMAGLGLVLTQLGRFDESIPLLEAANRKDPSNEVAKMFLSVSRARQQGLAQLDLMKARAKADPDDWQIRHNLFTTLGYARRMDEAEVYGEEIRKLDPQVAEAYVSMGVVYFSNGDIQKAEESHRKALSIKEDAGAYLGLAHFYERTDQPEKAIEAYENVIRVKPDVPNIMILYAKYLLDLGLRRQALDVFKRSLALQPHNAEALLHAGYLSARLGDIDGAKGYLETLRGLGSPKVNLLERCIRVWTPTERR
ncbi:MAG: tetratricopeptide repeat protein [Acidobacteriota bacterium]|nr:MAG: tetratricopeptide repeat protein [Acidobacteriota bacterium]